MDSSDVRQSPLIAMPPRVAIGSGLTVLGTLGAAAYFNHRRGLVGYPAVTSAPVQASGEPLVSRAS